MPDVQLSQCKIQGNQTDVKVVRTGPVLVISPPAGYQAQTGDRIELMGFCWLVGDGPDEHQRYECHQIDFVDTNARPKLFSVERLRHARLVPQP